LSRQPVGTVYLLHFDQPVSDHARHYLGWASDLAARLEAHRDGRGARLMEVCKERGITWHLSRTWEGTRTRERAIKDRAESPRLCPDCTPHPRPVAAGRSASAQPAPKPVSAPAPVPGPGPSSVWPGRPDLEAERDGYAKYQELVDALARQWPTEAAGPQIGVPAPRPPEPEAWPLPEPEPEPELEMEI
jgi:predicted GIY-YIG superfamily endonuclease